MHKYPIGTKYRGRGKHGRLCTVIDHLTTTNSAGRVISERYVSSHEFCGQTVTETDISEITISRCLWDNPEAA